MTEIERMMLQNQLALMQVIMEMQIDLHLPVSVLNQISKCIDDTEKKLKE